MTMHPRPFRRPTTAPHSPTVAVVGALATALTLAACGGGGGNEGPRVDQALAQQGQSVFRYETFGDETQWTDTLRMNEVIQAAVDPVTALGVGLKVDSDALPPAVVDAIKAGDVDLTSTQTTLALIELGAVVGVQGTVATADDGTKTLTRVGITCALCHSTVDNSASKALGLPDGIGKRLDGWPNRQLNPGAIIALSPFLDSLGADAAATVRGQLNSWGPGKYDPRYIVGGGITDPGVSHPAVIPPAYGLFGLKNAIFTGDGDVQHEPVGPVAYWNRYVSVTQMGGHGTFLDPRLPQGKGGGTGVNNIGADGVDMVTAHLPALQEYQYSIDAPAAPAGSYDSAAAARGQALFAGKANCASCHSGALFTDATEGKLHPADASVAADKVYITLSATQQWRTSPLKGVWQHAPYFHDGSAATLADVVTMYNDNPNRPLHLTEREQADLVEYLKSL
ncbi:MAG: c-type cytochrome [Comamonadaceae bacterium]|nr:c-type cytochrome [Comamonadaceae bacterium]